MLQCLFDLHEWQSLKSSLLVAHTYGEGNFASDCASRQRFEDIAQFCSQLNIQPRLVILVVFCCYCMGYSKTACSETARQQRNNETAAKQQRNSETAATQQQQDSSETAAAQQQQQRNSSETAAAARQQRNSSSKTAAARQQRNSETCSLRLSLS